MVYICVCVYICMEVCGCVYIYIYIPLSIYIKKLKQGYSKYSCAYKLNCHLWYYFVMLFLGKPRAVITNSVGMNRSPKQSEVVVLFLIQFSDVALWQCYLLVCFLEGCHSLFFTVYFLCMCIFFCITLQRKLFNKAVSKYMFLHMASHLSLSRWYRLLCLSYSHIIPSCIQNLIFTPSLSASIPRFCSLA